MTLRETVNYLVDLLGCTRHQAVTLIHAAKREGYAVTNTERS